MELLLGCGKSRVKKLVYGGRSEWTALTTLDHEPRHEPDVVWDMNVLPLPFGDDTFDEIHAYECLEHCGRQGHAQFFFGQFADFWRILKPDGVLLATVPAPDSPWAWGDPSHTRIIHPASLTFLSQPNYDAQIGLTAMSDFRSIYHADFDLIHSQVDGDAFAFVLRAVKPSRITRD